MKHILIGLTAAASALAFSSTAAAGEFQASAGGTYIFDSSDTEFSFTTATVRGAYYVKENWGFEAEGSFGISGVDNYANTGIDFKLNNQFGGYLIGKFPTGENGEFFGRIGWRAGSFGASGFGGAADIDYNGFSIGGGYSHFFTESVGLRGEITTSGANLGGGIKPEGNLTSASVSMVFKLGAKKK